MLTENDKKNYKKLCMSLETTNNNIIFESNDRETESLYRFGWFYINNYKYSISAWSFLKGVVTFEQPNGYKVKYDLLNHCVVNNTFLKDNMYNTIKKRVKITLSDWLKDLSDKLRD